MLGGCLFGAVFVFCGAKTMNTPARILVTFGLVVGAGFFGFRLGRQQIPVADTRAKSSAAADGRETGRLRDENARLRTENERLTKTMTAHETPAAASPALPAIVDEHAVKMAQLRALAEAQKGKSAYVDLPIVTRDGKLAPEFAKMFDLTPTENEALQRAVAQGRQQIDGLLAANATVTPTGDTIVVQVKSFAGGGDVYDMLMDAFARTLGPERNELFLALQTDQLTRAFNSFGAEDRTLTFSREATTGGTGSLLTLRDLQRAPHGSTSSSMSYPDLSKLPEQYAWVVPLVPQVSSLPARPRTPVSSPGTLRP
jgi:hypothetical protein